jgi:ornithine--oxo-acid transaminase
MALDPVLPSRLIDQENRYGVPAERPFDLVFSRADGVYLWDVQGNRYMDLYAGAGAVAQGHNHTRIAAAMVEQCLRLCLASPAFRNDRLPALLEKLCGFTGFERALMANSGSEAMEAAIQACRRWGCRHKRIPRGEGEIIVFSGSRHGRTLTLLGCAGSEGGVQDFEPFPSGFRLLPYGDLAAVRSTLGPRTCAVLVEPVQGSAGVVVPPKGFLKGLRELCDGARTLLIADEIQSGLGRTGRLFGFEHEEIRPDGVVLGAALSGGFYPVSALLGPSALLEDFPTQASQSTYAGSPLGCSVASVALDVLLDERLIDRAAELGAYLLERLRALNGSKVREIRGLGLWAGLDLKPGAGGALAVCEALRQEGLLCVPAGAHTLRLCPPLTISREQLDWALGKLKLVLS